MTMTHEALPITPAQRQRLFGLGKCHGLDIDELRSLTPTGSIAALTRTQAGELIGRLGGGTRWSHLEAQGTASARQLRLIGHLRESMGFRPHEFDSWLSRFKVSSLAGIRDRELARKVIGALFNLQRHRKGV